MKLSLLSKERRATRTMVEVTIGIVGLMAVMLAQIGSNKSLNAGGDNAAHNASVKVVSHLTDTVLRGDLPAHLQFSWSKLFF